MLPRLPAMYRGLSKYAKGRDRYSEAEIYAFIQDCFAVFMKAARLEVIIEGATNIPQTGGFVLYPNHQSFLDIPAVTLGCPRPIAAIMKRELAETPVVKQLAAATGSRCLDREDDRQAIKVIREVSEEVKAGKGYLVFPEGTRGNDGALLDFKAGSFKCATKAKRPIIPVVLKGTRGALSSSVKPYRRIRVIFLDPISFEEYGKLNSHEIAAEVKRRIFARLSADSTLERPKAGY